MNNDDLTNHLKHDIVEMAHRLYARRLVAGRGGNVSARQADDCVLITPHSAPLGFMSEQDLIAVDLNGGVVSGKGRPSTETLLHLAVYRELPARAVVHAHPPLATALSVNHDCLKPLTFETFFALGEVKVIPQETPTIVETAPVIEALRLNSVVLLGRHGAVTIGESVEDAYFLMELLEEAAEMIVAAGQQGLAATKRSEAEAQAPGRSDTSYQLFSEEHISAICKLINDDTEAQKRGRATGLNTRLGIKLDETGQTYSIHLETGKVTSVGAEEDVDFLIAGPESAWRQVFGGQIDPFVAVTQRRLKLRGDLGKLSRWYSPFYRIFELWKLAPIQ